MKKVITYGTYDMLHEGHIRLLERAKKLGDYLIVGITSDDYDKSRGKINVQQSLAERIAGVSKTGLADQIIIEEYEGQKIDDIQKYGVDIFTVGSDWIGKFDYLNEYCKVIYLERTKGISSTDIRAKDRLVRLGLVGESENNILCKYYKESKFANGAKVIGVCSKNPEIIEEFRGEVEILTSDYECLLDEVDAVYILSEPTLHYDLVKKALKKRKHVLVESPVCLSDSQAKELFDIAAENGVVLMDSIKTAYSLAYERLMLLIKCNEIGAPVSIDATCTSIATSLDSKKRPASLWNSMCSWGPTALLPVFQIFGDKPLKTNIYSIFSGDPSDCFDIFSKIDMVYSNGIASVKVGRGVKSEGELIISGTKGYIFVPAPWWKTDYFEIRYENLSDNKRFFYQLNGEGIRNELVAFVKSIVEGEGVSKIDRNISIEICRIMRMFYEGDSYCIMGEKIHD